MKIVVTGATGHLGTYVVHALATAGHEVVAASRSGQTPRRPFGASAVTSRPLRLDVTSDECIAVLAAELGSDVAVIHLAAWHPPATAQTGPGDRGALLEANVLGTMRVLDAARSAKVASVVYASTFEVYGEPRSDEITEEARTEPITDYGATKLSGEHHLWAFAQEEGVRTVSLRMPAIYGPGEKTPRALPNFLRSVARGERPVIFGDGADLRDQLHARDAAQAVALSLSSSARGVFNVADGRRHSILELATVALSASQTGGEPERRDRQKPRRDYHMSIQKAQRDLGFQSAVTLEEGMAEELAWIRRGEA